jgi:hypothetical protein
MRNPAGETMIENVKHWALLIGMSAFLGVYTARMIVYMPDWWAEFYNFWIMGGWRP